MSGAKEQRPATSGSGGDANSSVIATQTKPKASNAAQPSPAFIMVHDDAKKFATSLQGEILTRLEQHSANLDKLFDAESLR